jgi:membrane protein
MPATGSLAHAVGETVGVGSTAVTVWNIVKWPSLVRPHGRVLGP